MLQAAWQEVCSRHGGRHHPLPGGGAGAGLRVAHVGGRGVGRVLPLPAPRPGVAGEVDRGVQDGRGGGVWPVGLPHLPPAETGVQHGGPAQQQRVEEWSGCDSIYDYLFTVSL